MAIFAFIGMIIGIVGSVLSLLEEDLRSSIKYFIIIFLFGLFCAYYESTSPISDVLVKTVISSDTEKYNVSEGLWKIEHRKKISQYPFCIAGEESYYTIIEKLEEK